MNKLLTLALLTLALSCQRKAIPSKESTLVKDSTVTKIVYLKKDSLIYSPGAKVFIDVPVPCPEANFTTSATGTNGIKATATIGKGRLSVDCQTDSLKQVISWLEAQLTKERFTKQVTVKQVPFEVEVPNPFIPKWVWYTLGASLLLNAFFFRVPIVNSLKRVLKW